MNYGWLESILLGIVTGLTEILPVSVQAHSRILMKFLGRSDAPALLELLIHLAIFAALYLSCQVHIIKMFRAKSMSRIPKKKRKRPLDTRSLMDLSLWQTMLLPVILAILLMNRLETLSANMIIMATFLFLNGLILYIPQFLPSSNKDCRMLSRVEGLLMGLGGCLFAIPGFSGMGAALSVASVSGVDRKYGLNMILLMQMGVMAGKMVYDILGLFSAGLAGITISVVLAYIVAAVLAFVAAFLAIKALRALAADKGYGMFGYYSWGLAMFTFILSLMA